MAEVIGALRWYLEIDGITEGIFQSVDGLNSETEIIEHRHTGPKGNLIINKIPGALKWGNITFKRGITDDKKLQDWRKKIEDGQIEANRKNGTITLYSPDLKPVAKYTFVKGWPTKWNASTLDASKNEMAIETMEIAHEGLTRQS
jgi:phage tail-like protein